MERRLWMGWDRDGDEDGDEDATGMKMQEDRKRDKDGDVREKEWGRRRMRWNLCSIGGEREVGGQGRG